MTGKSSRNSITSRPAFELSGAIEKRLRDYTEAAVAAGVSVVALALPGHAKVVYTPSDTPIPVFGGWVPLDLNHDGFVDFSFLNRSLRWDRSSASLLQVTPKNQSNALRGRGSFSSFYFYNSGFPTALRPGFSIGPSRLYFQKGKRGL